MNLGLDQRRASIRWGRLELDWSVVRTHPFAAKVALENLQRQALVAYDPQELIVRVTRGRKVERTVQLFQDYLFVDAGERRNVLRSTRGICQLLPGFARQEEIDRLRALENESGLIALRDGFRIGDKVNVQSGPFAGTLGIYDGQSTRERVFVLMSWLGSQRRVQIKEICLVAA